MSSPRAHACWRKPVPLAAPARQVSMPLALNFRNLSLVDESVMDEGAVLHAIASRQESRANLVLHLLGQRFGVLAAAPAFDSERIPLGPQALCRAIRHATESVQLDHGARLLFYRIFDRRVMVQCLGLAEKLDALLVEEGVLPGLTYVPMRSRASGAGGGDGDVDSEAEDEIQEPAEDAGAGKSAQGARQGGSQGGGSRAGGAPQAQGGGQRGGGQQGGQSWMSGPASSGGHRGPRDGGHGDGCRKLRSAALAKTTGNRKAASRIRRHPAEIPRFGFNAKTAHIGCDAKVESQRGRVPLVKL